MRDLGTLGDPYTLQQWTGRRAEPPLHDQPRRAGTNAGARVDLGRIWRHRRNNVFADLILRSCRPT
jgi:hypothetical protein